MLILIILLKYRFGICLCSMFSAKLLNVSNLLQITSLSYFQPKLAAIIVTIATVKVKSIPEIYT